MRQKFRKRPSTKPEERHASEAVQELTASAKVQIQQAIERLGALALRDAGLKAEDGWRFDVDRCVYVRFHVKQGKSSSKP